MNPVPLPEAMPLPGPPGLLRFFLVMGWVVHAYPMQLMLGGAFLLALTDAAGLWRGSEPHRRLARRMARALPVVVALSITFGIVPFLMLQTLYGPAYFPSAVLMAWPFLSLVAALAAAYYGSYLIALLGDRLGRGRIVMAVTSALLLAWVGFLFSSNSTLINHPEVWGAMYLQDGYGRSLPSAIASLGPRFGYMLAGAVALAGAGLVVYGAALKLRAKASPLDPSWVVRYGAGWAAVGAGVQSVMALFWWNAEPAALRAQAAGGSLGAPAGWLYVSLGLLLAATVLGLLGTRRRRTPAGAPAGGLDWISLAGAGAVLLNVPVAALLREQLRRAALAPYLPALEANWRFQLGPFLLFLGGFVMALAVIGYVLWRVILVPARPGQGGGDVPAREEFGPPLPAKGGLLQRRVRHPRV